MKHTYLKFTLFILTLLATFFAWRSVDSAINVVDASVWMTPTLRFSLFFILLALSIVLIKEFYLVLLLTFFAVIFSMFFAPGAGHLLIIMIGFLFLLLAVAKIKKDLNLNIKVSLWKSVRTGSTIIIFSLGLIITSQYYFTVKDVGVRNLIPKFKMEGLSNTLTSKILSTMNPDFKDMETDSMTVDQLILETQKNQMQDLKMPGEFSGQIDQIALVEGRKQLSQIIGSPVTGKEKISDLISETINNKINNFIVPNSLDDKSFPILPIIMAFIMFLTVVSLGSFLSPLWILIVSLIFRAIVGTGLVKINKVMQEVEVIE